MNCPRKHRNISSIVAEGLCHSCGACYGVCPVDAIAFKETEGGYYIPEINDNRCTLCGLCDEVCPGAHFGKTLRENMPEDPFTGRATHAYVGKAVDQELFHHSQSGGIASAILLYALETGAIDAAVTVVMQEGTPPRPEVKTVTTREEILASQRSKYCPVPLLNFIKEFKKTEKKIAVVGTACQIHGLINILDKMPEYKERITFTLGLVCDRVMTYAGMDYLLKKALPENGSAKNMYFRDKHVSGYPGDVHVFSQKGASYPLPAKVRMAVKDVFTPARCRVCFDKMNVFSDLTVCDPHGLENIDRENGESVVIVRSQSGERILNSALSDKAILVHNVEYEKVLSGQKIDTKRRQWQGYAEAWRRSGRRMPDYYHQMKEHALPPENLSRCEGDLSHSFSLDRLSKTGQLSRMADRVLRKKRNKEILHLPQRLLKKVYHKITSPQNR